MEPTVFTVHEVQVALAVLARLKDTLVMEESSDEVVALVHKASSIVTYLPNGVVNVPSIRVVI